ncbi:Transcriptional regulator [gamma proteobacterium HdN1]|nr:Transcriptional regulator [gamma proteobacterium HdN1]
MPTRRTRLSHSNRCSRLPMSKKNSASRPKNREAAKQETHEALIRAATELFKEQGLDVSLDAVCARAGYTRGAFYVHFKDRDALISAVMGQIGDQVLDILLGKEDEQQDLLALVPGFIQALLSGDYPLSRKGGLPPHQLLDACARSEDIRIQYVQLIQKGAARLANALREGQKKGLVRANLAPESTALVIVSMVIGFHTMYDLAVPMDMGGEAHAVLQLLIPSKATDAP